MKRIVAGILAHVDAGKTTLSESLLYMGGAIRTLGRVDHKNTLLDAYTEERNRGITIFAKQAQLMAGDTQVILMDTPGHADFAAEMERTLSILDYAILVISGADGIQGHTMTLWKLLCEYNIPTFIFINKMDQINSDKASVYEQIRGRFGTGCVDFTEDADGAEAADSIGNNAAGNRIIINDTLAENIAVCDEKLLGEYIDGRAVTQDDVRRLVKERRLFPCYFGSALKLEGISELMQGIDRYTKPAVLSDEAGARVFKITRDEQGNRLTHMKITGRPLKVKEVISGVTDGNAWQEKVNQIRIYQGAKYETVSEAEGGMICTVTGLSETYPGQGLGAEKNMHTSLLQPVLSYSLILPDGTDAAEFYKKILVLQDEEPELDITWNNRFSCIQIKLMGKVQTEILYEQIKERFGVGVSFGPGSIVYRETIKNTVEGVGHYEPLRHYAEVHLIMEPAERGSGLVFDTDCSEEVLDKNWQRLILTHLREKEHCGVLTGAAITDMKITVAAGRAHIKHTEGGDFRQATYRAVRQGLMKAESILLEPVYEFELEVPSDCVGRALNDMDRLKADFTSPEIINDTALIKGKAPVSLMQDYPSEVTAYTRGMGHISCEFGGYVECHNTDEVIAACGYEPEADTDNPSSSVFCSHGAGFVVPWEQVEDYMHVEGVLSQAEKNNTDDYDSTHNQQSSYSSAIYSRYENTSYSDDRELQEIFARTYKSTKDKTKSQSVEYNYNKVHDYNPVQPQIEYMLVDGYNVIHAWKKLSELAEDNMESARNVLMDILSNYQAYKNIRIILVFDAYRVRNNQGEVVRYHNIDVVYTKEAETADHYIEKTAHEIGHKYSVTVVTSDGVEQVIIRGAGCRLISSREFEEEVKYIEKEIFQALEEKKSGKKSYLFDNADEKLKQQIEDVRLGRKTDLL